MTVRRIFTSVSLLALLAAAFTVVGAAPSQAAQSAYGPPPNGPDLSLIAFAVSDFPSARVGRQGYVKPDQSSGFVSEYDREFRTLSVILGKKRLVDLEDDVMFAPNASDAAAAVYAFKLGLQLASAQIKKSIAKGFGVKPNAVKIGAPTRAGAGDDSVAARIRVATHAGEVDAVFAMVQVGSVVSGFYFVGVPKVKLGLAETRRLARLAVRHVHQWLAPPVNVSLPLVSGTPQDRRSVTAAPGTWSNASTLAFQWQRCDAMDFCIDLPDATKSSYTATSADVAFTLRVKVTATNRYGSTTAMSAETQAVSVAGAPVNTSPPTISGTAAVGQTLTAGQGSWSGNPTTFTYRWQRCINQGASCADIAGAASQSYVVGSSDAGAKLRLVVTATNAAGPASAASIPTAVVK